jgi:hypothetical protein
MTIAQQAAREIEAEDAAAREQRLRERADKIARDKATARVRAEQLARDGEARAQVATLGEQLVRESAAVDNAVQAVAILNNNRKETLSRLSLAARSIGPLQHFDAGDVELDFQAYLSSAMAGTKLIRGHHNPSGPSLEAYAKERSASLKSEVATMFRRKWPTPPQAPTVD